MSNDVSSKYPCIILGGRHPLSAITGDDDIASVRLCIQTADEIPGDDFLVWLGDKVPPPLRELGPTPKQLEPFSVRPESIEEVAPKVLKHIRESGAGEYVIVVCAPLIYEAGAWHVEVLGSSGEVFRYELLPLIECFLPKKFAMRVRVVFHPFRHWASGTRALPVDLPDDLDCVHITAALQKPRALLQGELVDCETVHFEGWHPGRKGPPPAARSSGPPRPASDVLRSIAPLGPRRPRGSVLAVIGRRNEPQVARFCAVANALGFDAHEIPGGPVPPRVDVLAVLHAAAVGDPVTVQVIDRSVRTSALVAVVFDTGDASLERWRPESDAPTEILRGSAKVFTQALWLARRWFLLPQVPKEVSDVAWLTPVAAYLAVHPAVWRVVSQTSSEPTARAVDEWISAHLARRPILIEHILDLAIDDVNAVDEKGRLAPSVDDLLRVYPRLLRQSVRQRDESALVGVGTLLLLQDGRRPAEGERLWERLSESSFHRVVEEPEGDCDLVVVFVSDADALGQNTTLRGTLTTLASVPRLIAWLRDETSTGQLSALAGAPSTQITATTMTELLDRVEAQVTDHALKVLRKRLESSFDTPDKVRDVVVTAGIRSARIQLHGTARDMWFSVFEEIHKLTVGDPETKLGILRRLQEALEYGAGSAPK